MLFVVRSPWVLFELAEMMILLERRTLLFHGSGLIVGICIFILQSGSRFPGAGIILGRRNSPEFEPWTRSWGYGRRPRPAHSVPAAHRRSPEIGWSLFVSFIHNHQYFLLHVLSLNRHNRKRKIIMPTVYTTKK